MSTHRVAHCKQRFADGQPPTAASAALHAFLESDTLVPATVIETDGRALVLDLSAGSTALGADLTGIDVAGLSQLIDTAMHARRTGFAFGRWGEHRSLYDNEHFGVGEDNSRTIHLGVDLFCAAQTAVHTPLDGIVEVVANNDRPLDYGPLIILRHAAPAGDFFTLYGHLDLTSTGGLYPGQRVRAGERIAAIGSPPQNGNWPPHLHFQVILDLLGLDADYPGVAAVAEQNFWLTLSPSPARFFPDIEANALRAPRRRRG